MSEKYKVDRFDHEGYPCGKSPAVFVRVEDYDRLELALRAAEARVREECIDACKAEYLEGPVETEDDQAYDRAIDDCIAAIREKQRWVQSPSGQIAAPQDNLAPEATGETRPAPVSAAPDAGVPQDVVSGFLDHVEKHGLMSEAQIQADSNPNAAYRCKQCGALWRHHPDRTWSLYDAEQVPRKCCDNSPEFLSLMEQVPAPTGAAPAPGAMPEEPPLDQALRERYPTVQLFYNYASTLRAFAQAQKERAERGERYREVLEGMEFRKLDNLWLKPLDFCRMLGIQAKLATLEIKERADRLQAELAEAYSALKEYGGHRQNCAILTILTSDPPQRRPCDCGLAAAIAKAKEQK